MMFKRAKRQRRAGDAYRDARNWVMAEASYRLHLDGDPTDAAIWVQLGHTLKEQGRMADAAAAYGRGAALEPGNADTQQHWQFALDRASETTGAATLAPPVPAGLVAEAPAVSPLPPARPIVRQTAVLPDGVILFSVQDLLGYLHAHVTMSGIQRVQAGIALHAIVSEGDRVGFIIGDPGETRREGEFLLLDPLVFREVIDYASASDVDHDTLRGKLIECQVTAKIVRPGAGHTIVLLGAFWGHGNTVEQFMAPRQAGARIGAYIYDVIPISHPQYCDAALVVDFTLSVGELNLIADFIFTISDYSRVTLAALYSVSGMRAIPMRTVPLAHSLTTRVERGDHWPAALAHLRGRPYVAYVSTVEGRKNHAYVVQAWQELIAQGVDVPDLVFVGRRGWRINGLLDLLDGTHNLGGRVHIVHDLSDAELDSVYAHCAFTVFTSYVEGWGLPVGESLVQNVPCVASSTSSIPEVGGAFVDYVDPLNLRDGIETFRRMIVDTAYRDRRRREIERSFVARSWDDVGRDFLAKTKNAIAQTYPPRLIHPTLPPGVLFRPGDLLLPPPATGRLQPFAGRLLLGSSFYAVEPHGAWMKGTEGVVVVHTTLTPGDEVVVYVELTMAPGAAGRQVAVRVGNGASPTDGPERVHVLETGRRAILRAHGVVAPDGTCSVRIRVSGTMETRSADTRLFAIGLAAIGYARRNDPVACNTLVEQFFIHDMAALI